MSSEYEYAQQQHYSAPVDTNSLQLPDMAPEGEIKLLSDPLDLEIARLLDDDNVPPSETACSYCGLDSHASVVKCGTCNRWFCNGSSLRSGSHIINHLVLLKHNVVSLHEDLPLGADTLECYNCGTKNVFMLGFVAAKHDSVVVILCRMPCAQLRDINWETNEWQSLIDQRKLLPWIAPVPSDEDMAHTRSITQEQLLKLEAQWRMNKNTSIVDIDNAEAEQLPLLPILLRYNDALEYQNVLAPLVEAEAEYDKSMKESQALEHILVQWSTSDTGRHLALFTLSTYEHSNLAVTVGDQIVLHHREFGASENDSWRAEGFITKLPSAHHEEFTLELLARSVPIPVSTGFTVEFVWKGTSYKRMQKALVDFATNEQSLSGYLYHKILGHEVVGVEFTTDIPSKLTVPKLASLNQSQIHAVATALKMPLTLIQGPPGTGKTVTSATIIYHLSRLHKQRILVCAPSNVAVDHLTEKLAQIGIKVVRLTARLREDVESTTSSHSLHKKVQRMAPKEVQQLLARSQSEEGLSKKKQARLQRQITKLEQQILELAEVICCTCVGAGDFRLSKMEFRSVLIDESTQATEPEVLIPIVKGAKQVILVGDHQQLGPVNLDKKAGEAGLNQSLFERLICLGNVPIRLEVQYRMHPSLSEFSSNMFYEGLLQNGVGSEDRSWPDSAFPWPVADSPMMFWGNYGKEEISSSGNSFLNRLEAMNVEKIITRLFRDGIEPHQIGVITPYEGQRAYIAQYMQMNSLIVEKRSQYVEVEVTSVDAFQGREKDFIILLCVRANDDRAIGFLRDPRRLNVALTRAKYGMVVLGNPRSLSKNKLWNHLLVHFREHGCLVEGPLDNLQFSMIPLGKIETTKKQGIEALRGVGAKDMDTQLMISFVPDEVLPEFQPQQQPEDALEQWPSLTSNEAGKLKLEQGTGLFGPGRGVLPHGGTETGDLGIDLRSIANAFASGLNI